MSKLIMFNFMSVDGFFEGATKWDINWHQTDEEFNDFAIEQLYQAGGIIFGRVTYEGMASFWPSPTALETDPIVAEQMNSLPKFVFSKTLDKADWNNSRLIQGDAAEELTKLKQLSHKDLFIFGSANLASTFAQHRLIDEYRIMVNPVVLGKGSPLFKENTGMHKLRLVSSRKFGNGNILLIYIPDEN